MTDTASRLPPGPRLIEAYYLATPLFFLVDVFLSFPIRVSALADPGLRYLYYAFALGCGVASRVRPKVGPYVGLAESSLNILLLILSVMLPIAQLPDRVFAGESTPGTHLGPHTGQFRALRGHSGGQLPRPPGTDPIILNY